jgi:hypothetical protein
MILFRFNGTAQVEGNTYVDGQVIAFPEGFDLTSLPGEEVPAAPVFMDHVPR